MPTGPLCPPHLPLPACLVHSRSQLAHRTSSVPSPELSTRNWSSRSTGGSPLEPFTTVGSLWRRGSQDPDAPALHHAHTPFQARTKYITGSCVAAVINIPARAPAHPDLPLPGPGHIWEPRGTVLGYKSRASHAHSARLQRPSHGWMDPCLGSHIQQCSGITLGSAAGIVDGARDRTHVLVTCNPSALHCTIFPAA